jgi:hypothetical protein
MNQKLSDWASFAEIVSGIAVVVTLVFLVLSIRDNTATTRAAVYSDMIDEFNELGRSIFEDPELSRLFDAYIDQTTAELEETEQRRLRKVALSEFRSYEKAYFNRQYGVIGDAEWERMQSGMCLNYDRATSLGMQLGQIGVLTQEFRDHIGNLCSETPR